MASFWYTYAKSKIMSGDIDLDTDSIRAALVMTNTTCDTEEDKQLMNAFTTLDEMDGANYVRKVLASTAVAADEANDRGEFDADDVTWSSLGAGTREIAALVIYKHVTDDTDSIPIAYMYSTDFPFPAVGATIIVQWDAEGILQVA
jgi:hypothetical protein